MRWRQARRSENVEDRRGMSYGRPVALGGGALLVVIVAALLGADPTELLRLLGESGTSVSLGDGAGTPSSAPQPPDDDPDAAFVSTVLADTEDTWAPIFARLGRDYRHPRLVLFTDQIPSACGFSSAAMGPFYCPGDERVYIDLGFFRELSERFGAPGDFARAYVIAHEVGHHVQNMLGISERITEMQRSADRAEANALSVRLELEADCFAGVWGQAAAARGLLEEGDVEDGLAAAAAIGDDRIQRMSGDRVHPESWTHGSSEQRVHWFRKGLAGGDLNACDTFRDASL